MHERLAGERLPPKSQQIDRHLNIQTVKPLIPLKVAGGGFVIEDNRRRPLRRLCRIHTVDNAAEPDSGAAGR